VTLDARKEETHERKNTSHPLVRFRRWYRAMRPFLVADGGSEEAMTDDPTQKNADSIREAEDERILAELLALPKDCPRCGAAVQQTPLTPPDVGIAFGCTRCSWPGEADPICTCGEDADSTPSNSLPHKTWCPKAD
jgi:hypothetical protein